jgi:hypothetical protein
VVSDNEYDLGLLSVISTDELRRRIEGTDRRPWQSFDEWNDQARQDRLKRWGYK